MNFPYKPILVKDGEGSDIYFIEQLSEDRLIFQPEYYSPPKIWNIITNEIENIDQVSENDKLVKLDNGYFIGLMKRSKDLYRSYDFSFYLLDPNGVYKYTSEKIKIDSYNTNVISLPNNSILIFNEYRIYIFDLYTGNLLRSLYTQRYNKIHLLPNGKIAFDNYSDFDIYE